MRKLVVSFVFALLPALAVAQGVHADTYTLNTGPCVMRSGTVQPETNVVGNICDTYWRTTAGTIYLKQSGTGTNTGWLKISMIGGSGTTDKVTKWTAPQIQGDSTITDVSGGDLTLGPAGDIVLGPVGADVFPNTNYGVNLGSLSKKYLTLHAAELWVETLVAQNTIATIGGRVLVAPTNMLAADITNSQTVITVKYNNFVNGDMVYMEANGKVEFIFINSSAGGSAGAYTYTVVRNQDGSGGDVWNAGDAMLDTGQAGNGFIDLYSVRGIKSGSEAGPSIVGNVRNSTTYNDWSPRWAIGNLNGLYGYSSNIYGTAFGVPTGAWVKIEPTNGVRIGYNTTTNIQLDASGNASFTGAITSTSGTIGGWSISSSSIFSGSGTGQVGLIAGAGAGSAAIYAGSSTPSTAPFKVTSDGYMTAAQGTIANFTIITNYLAAGSTNATRVVLSADGTRAMWAGHLDPDLAPFHVYANGDLRASSATITGNITATSGNVLGALAAGSITATYIAANTITAAKIAAGTITATEIAANTITAAKIAAGTITATEIAANTITAGKMNVSTLSSITADIGAVTAGSVVVGSSNKIWLNDSSDGRLAIGGSTQSTAPFYVDNNGDVRMRGIVATDFLQIITATTFQYLIGGGNRTLCVNNSGVLYTVASGAAC